MRWRVLFFASLGVNIALAGVWLSTRRNHRAAGSALDESLTQAAPTVKTNILVRRQFFTWAELESPDYPTYISNLRDIGCPEQTIRDIIIAEINALYARRLATEVVTPDQQWWRSEPDPAITRQAAEKARLLEEDRRQLLTRLLGPDWESGDLLNLPRPSRPGVPLDGPVLGHMPVETKLEVEEISVRAGIRMQNYLQSQQQQGRNPDPAEIARLEQQLRDELTRVLNSAQLEEYLLRYSDNANDLRAELGELTHFGATSNEFRAIFRATDAIDLQLAMLEGSTDANSILQRRTLEQQRDAAIKLALGPERYRQFVMLHDPIYREAVAAAQQAGTPEAAQTLYAINSLTAQQQTALLASTNLTPEQMAVERARIEFERSRAIAQAMGQEIPGELPPGPPPIPQRPVIRGRPHRVVTGETAASVAQRYNVTMSALQEANPNVDFRRLRGGETLIVPPPP